MLRVLLVIGMRQVCHGLLINMNLMQADLAALGARLDGIDERLKHVEARQLELLQLASFGKGSLKTLLRVGAAMAALAGIGLAIKTYLS